MTLVSQSEVSVDNIKNTTLNHRLCMGDAILTNVTISVTLCSESRSRQGRSPDAIRHTERVRCPRAVSQTALGRLWASCGPPLRAVGGVHPLDWNRQGRVTPAQQSVPAVPAVAHELCEPGFVMRMPRARKPGLKLDGGVPTSPGRAAVERRQASASRRMRCRAESADGWIRVCRRSASLLSLS